MAGRIRTWFEGRFGRHLAIYLGFDFLNRGISFLLLPLFTRFVAPEDYGVYIFFLTFSLVCEPFLDLSMNYAIPRVYVTPGIVFRDYISTLVFFSLFLLGIQLMILGGIIILSRDLEWVPVFLLWGPPIAFSNLMTRILTWILRMEERPISFGVLNIYSVLLQIVLNLTAVVGLKAGWRGLLWVQLLLACLRLLPVFWLLVRNCWLGFRFDWGCLKFGLKWGLGFLPAAFSAQIDAVAGRFFLARYFAMETVGVYSMGEKLGTITSVYVQSLSNVYQPWLFKVLSKSDKDFRQVILSFGGVILSCFLVAWGGTLCVYLMRSFILGDKFQSAMVYVFLSASKEALRATFWFTALFISYKLKTWIVSAAVLMVAGTNVLLSWLFLSVLGVVGVVCAPLVGWGAVTLVLMYVAFVLWRTPLRMVPERRGFAARDADDTN